MLPRSTRPLALGTAVALPAPVAPAALLGAVPREETRTARTCPPRAKGQVVCADDALCVCAMSGQLTNAERAVLNDVSTSAARLATVLAWIFTLAAVALVVLLLLR